MIAASGKGGHFEFTTEITERLAVADQRGLQPSFLCVE